MLRRDFVRALVTIGVAPKFLLGQQQATPPGAPPPAPVPWLLGLNPKTPLPHVEVAEDVAATELRFFSPLQMQTLTRLAEVLVPPVGDKPGALQAGVPAFLDFLMASSPETRQQVYAGGLDWLEQEAQKKYQTPFSKVSDGQAGALLTPWLRTWMTDHPPTETHADFVNIAHDEIRLATVNSRPWFEATPPPTAPDPFNRSLYWYPIQPDVRYESAECAKIPAHVQAAPKSGHPMPQYPR
ncbi:gluconate 2-dehydrogenase subunit 3 family protein [Acidobacteria bacterium AB60]|nr:gluconate 2-dehydrogenase subunit 3 family protein [Acidobacteria bacterium AB60]